MFVNLTDTPDQAVADDDFGNQIRKILSKQQDNPIYVRGDKDVDYGRVVKVMVMLQNAGAENVGLITDPTVTVEEIIN